MDIIGQLNNTTAGQIALNLDKQDGTQNGTISQDIWTKFWNSHGGDEYKGKNENVTSDGVSVQEAINLIMTRIFNAARKTGENVNKLGNKWFNDIEDREQLDASNIAGLSSSQTDDTEEPAPTDGTDKPDAPPATEDPNEPNPKTQPNEGTYSTESIKVKVPQKFMSKDAKDIIAARNEAKNIKKYDEKKLDAMNVAYVVNNIGLTGLNKDDLALIYTLMYARMESWYMNVKNFKNPDEFKKLPINGMAGYIRKCKSEIIKIDNKIITDSQKQKDAWNNDLPKMQAQFDAANELLVQVANSNPKPEITRNPDNKSARVDLQDGIWIDVVYDTNGEISQIKISHHKTPDKAPDGTQYYGGDVCYNKDEAYVDTIQNTNSIGYEYRVKSGYNWDELVRIAESIFGTDPKDS